MKFLITSVSKKLGQTVSLLLFVPFFLKQTLSNKLEHSEFNLEKNIGIKKHAGKFRKWHCKFWSENGTNHRKLVPCYLIISLAKMFRYGPPGPKFLESTSLQGAWTHFSFVETGNDWRTNEVHSTPYENKSHHLSFQMFGRFGYEIKQDEKVFIPMFHYAA